MYPQITRAHLWSQDRPGRVADTVNPENQPRRRNHLDVTRYKNHKRGLSKHFKAHYQNILKPTIQKKIKAHNLSE